MSHFLLRAFGAFAAILLAVPCSAQTYHVKTLADAAAHRDLAAAKFLLQHGASVDAPIGQYRLTALDFAAANDTLPIVKLFVEHKANVNARNLEGYTPLMYAAGGGAHALVLSYLLQHGADAAEKADNGFTALHMAALNHGRSEIIPLLMRHGAAIDAEDRDGETPLTTASKNQNTAMVRALLANGANGAYALVWESYTNQISGVRALLNAGVEVDSRYPGHFGAYDRSTALIEAARQNNLAMAQLLVQHHADVNAMLPGDGNMTTALMFAAYNCNAEIIRLLAENGARDNIRGGEGNAYDLARSGWTSTMQACDSDVLSTLSDIQ